MISKNWFLLFIQRCLQKWISDHHLRRILNIAFAVPKHTKHPLRTKVFQKRFWQGIRNQAILPLNPNGIWPYWMKKQFDPSSPSYSYDTSPFSTQNTRFRNWTLLGSPFSAKKVLVDPHGLTQVEAYKWSFDTFILFNGKVLDTPKDPNQTLTNNQLLITEVEHKPCRLTKEVFCLTYPETDTIVFNKSTITNTSDKDMSLSLLFTLRPYTLEGISPISDITYLTQNCFVINNRPALILDEKPDNILCLTQKDGDSLDKIGEWQMVLKAHCPNHQATGIAEYKISLKPGESISKTCKIPANSPIRQPSNTKKKLPKKVLEKIISECTSTQALNLEEERKVHQQFWKKEMDHFAEISIPHPLSQTLLSHTKHHLLRFLSLGGVMTSPLRETEQWMQTIQALNYLGYHSCAEKLLSHYPIKNNLKKPYNIPEMGHITYTLMHHYDLTQSKLILETLFPVIERFIRCIEKNSKNPDYAHLQNPSFSHDTGETNTHLIDSLWACYIIKSGIKIGTILSSTKHENHYHRLFHSTWNSIQKWITHVADINHATPFIPITPSGRKDDRLFDFLYFGFPLNLFSNQDDLLKTTLQHAQNFLKNNLRFSYLNKGGYDTANNCLLALQYAQQQDPHYFKVLSWLQQTASQTGTWPEAIHPTTKKGCYLLGHDSGCNALYIHLIRNSLVQEHESCLKLTPICPKEWFTNHSKIEWKKLPTSFGPIDVTITMIDQLVTYQLSPQFHTAPENIEISLPFSIQHIESTTPILKKRDKSFSCSPKTTEVKITIK